MHKTLFATLALTAGLLTSFPTLAAEPVPEYFRHLLRQGAWEEKFVADLLVQYRQADRDRDGLSDKDLVFAQRFAAIKLRVQQIRMVVSRDLDGDGRVSDEEIGVVVREEYGRRGVLGRQELKQAVDREVKRILSLDRNRDRNVDLDEAMTVDPANTAHQRDVNIRVLEHLMSLDPNRDGVLNEEEARQVALTMFRQVDRNEDRMIDQREYRWLNDQISGRSNPVHAPCDLPQAATNADIVLLGIQKGSAVASVAIGDPEHLITAQTLVIEPGETPLYLVLNAAQRVVWNITGARDRVSRAVVIAQNGQRAESGVAGLTKEKVSFLTPGSCNAWFVKADGGRARLAATRIGNALDRPIAGLIGAQAYGLGAINVPSGEMEKVQKPSRTPKQTDSPVPDIVLRDLWRLAPGGYVQIDLEELVASDPFRAAPVRPGIFGVMDLFDNGHLVLLSDGMMEIVKPFDQFPAEMPPAYRRFMMSDRLPLPGKIARGMQIWSRESGEPRDLDGD